MIGDKIAIVYLHFPVNLKTHIIKIDTGVKVTTILKLIKLVSEITNANPVFTASDLKILSFSNITLKEYTSKINGIISLVIMLGH